MRVRVLLEDDIVSVHLQMLDASTPVWGLTVQGQKRPVLVTLYEHGAYVR